MDFFDLKKCQPLEGSGVKFRYFFPENNPDIHRSSQKTRVYNIQMIKPSLCDISTNSLVKLKHSNDRHTKKNSDIPNCSSSDDDSFNNVEVKRKGKKINSNSFLSAHFNHLGTEAISNKYDENVIISPLSQISLELMEKPPRYNKNNVW